MIGADRYTGSYGTHANSDVRIICESRNDKADANSNYASGN